MAQIRWSIDVSVRSAPFGRISLSEVALGYWAGAPLMATLTVGALTLFDVRIRRWRGPKHA
ncbi:hypothetical protein ACWERV_32895 [Streptomyces sp. NPDC004031]